jgi:phosphoglycerate kinase
MTSNIEFMEGVKTLKDIDVSDKKVLIRVDFNVPLDDHHNITDDTRIEESLRTINHCIDHGAKSIVLVSHLGRPKGKDENLSLRHILKRLERLLKEKVIFVEDFEKDEDEILNASDAQLFLFENIRFYEGETKNSEELGRKLAKFADVFVNDAFGTSHRKHASTYAITEFVDVKVAGFLLKREIDAFAKALYNPIKPILLVIGGAKVSSKITLLKNILPKVERIIIGGAMSNTFLSAMDIDMKASLVEEEYLDEAKEILQEAKHLGVKIYLPFDVVSTNDINDPVNVQISPVYDIQEGMKAVDIGPASCRFFEEVVALSNTIIWNGPMGVFEIDKFSKGTIKLAHSIADSYAYTIVGGGDTVNAINKAGERENISFVSTGGGASLELLEGRVLPAFEHLDRR